MLLNCHYPVRVYSMMMFPFIWLMFILTDSEGSEVGSPLPPPPPLPPPLPFPIGSPDTGMGWENGGSMGGGCVAPRVISGSDSGPDLGEKNLFFLFFSLLLPSPPRAFNDSPPVLTLTTSLGPMV